MDMDMGVGLGECLLLDPGQLRLSLGLSVEALEGGVIGSGLTTHKTRKPEGRLEVQPITALPNPSF